MEAYSSFTFPAYYIEVAEIYRPYLRRVVLRPIFEPMQASPFERFSDGELTALLDNQDGQELAEEVRTVRFEGRNQREGDPFGDRDELAASTKFETGFVERVYGLPDRALEWVLESVPFAPSQMLRR